ncbi:MAG: DNA repair exonuclease [Verrucomicrobiaceae bacterium]|nr:DNA repair exonuclease [Verrucomicrobiaceae bacterium]
MFRFLHTADLLLDSPLRGLRSRDEEGVEALLGASRKAFEALIDLAISEAVDFVVIAGDVYDRDWKGYETGLFFRRGMARLDAAGISVYLISGNHDAASVISKQLSLPENVHVFPSKKPATEQPDAWPVAIHGMSFPNQAVDENLVPRYPTAVAGKFNLGLLHTSLAGGEGHDTYAPCSVADLLGKGYDYWALGHIHQPRVVHEDPWIVYPGNLQGRHIRECGPRGCRLVTVDDSLAVAVCDWHSLDVARWAEQKVDFGGVASFEEALPRLRAAMGEAVEAAEDRLLALRVVVEGVTAINGALRGRPDRLEAEADSITGDFGEGAVWIEKIKIATRPEVSLEKLAQRDGLTKVVVEATLGTPAESDLVSVLPAEVGRMLTALPDDIREELKKGWTSEGLREIQDDARNLILEHLVSKGGEA